MIFKHFVNFLNKKDKAIETEVLKSELMRKDVQIELLQDEVVKLTAKQIKLNKNKPTKPTKPTKLTEGILKVFKGEMGELNIQEVSERLNRSKLKNKKPTFISINSTLNNLVLRRKLMRGSKRGTYRLNTTK